MSKLQVLMLSYDDRVIAGETEDTQARHIRYADQVGHLHMIVWATAVANRKPVQVSDKLTVYPVGHQGRAFYVLEAWQTARRLCDQHSIDVITAQDPFFTALVGLWARTVTTKLQIQNHSDFLDNPHWMAERPRWNTFLNRLAKYTLPKADRWRVVNGQEKQKYIGLGLPAGKIDVLPVGVDVQRLAKTPAPAALAALREQHQLSTADRVLFWLGRNAPVKNLALAIEAFALLQASRPNLKLLIGGNVADTPSIQAALTTVPNPSNIIFLGAIDHQALPLYFALSDVYLQTSNYEGFGRTLVEAAAAGTPIVATETAGARSILQSNKTATLVPLQDAPALVAAIDGVFLHPQRAAALAQTAQSYVLKTFAPQTLERNIVRSWQQAVKD